MVITDKQMQKKPKTLYCSVNIEKTFRDFRHVSSGIKCCHKTFNICPSE